PRRTMRLLLVRHGQTPSNVAGLLDTAFPGPGLTALGARQAAAIPGALADRVVDGVAVSTLVRTHLTAAPLAERHGHDLLELDGLSGDDAGHRGGSAPGEAQRRSGAAPPAGGPRGRGRRTPGAPGGRGLRGRAAAGRAAVAEAGWEGAVAVSHGAAIRARG